jgi:hypothetical protein
VIELLFRGLQANAIAAYTSHSLSSVERYIADFARVMELCERHYPVPAIVRITALSPRTIRDYLALAQRYSKPAHQPVIQMLRQRFHSPFATEEESSWEHGRRHPEKPPTGRNDT